MPRTRAMGDSDEEERFTERDTTTTTQTNFVMTNHQLSALVENITRSQAETNRILLENLLANRTGSPIVPDGSSTPAPPTPGARAAGSSGNFAKCTARFDGGSRNPDELEAFIDAVEVFKECASVSDEHALRGLPMLLVGDAAVWWRGVRATVDHWDDALNRLRGMYGMHRPGYKIFRDIFSAEQGSERADLFVSRIRALLCKLPYDMSEVIKVDIVYGLLDRRIRKRVSRDDVDGLEKLIFKVRLVEEALAELLVAFSVFFNVIGKGAVLGFPAVLIPRLRDPDSGISITPEQESWIASVIAITQIVGLLIMMKSMDILGRRTCHLFSVSTLLFAWFIQILANGFTGILVARLLQGLGMGMSGTLAAVILGEMSDPKIRGMFFVVFSMSFTVGVLWVQMLGQFLSWQYTSLASSFTTFISLVLVYLSPESPSWLISKGRIEECREVFTWLRGSGPEATLELEKLIDAQMSKSKGKKMSFTASTTHFVSYTRSTCRKPEFYKPIIIMLHLHLVLQSSGTNVMNSYVTDIIYNLISPDANAKVIIIGLSIERLAANILAIFVIKTFNRRTVLNYLSVACVVICCLKSLYLYLKLNNLLIYDSPWIPTVLLFLFVLVLSSGMTAVTFTLSGEIFPLEFRGVGSGVSALMGNLFFFISVKCFPIFLISVGLATTYLMYASVLCYSLIVLWFMLPETKDRTLQDIEDHFTGKRRLDTPVEREMVPLKVSNNV